MGRRALGRIRGRRRRAVLSVEPLESRRVLAAAVSGAVVPFPAGSLPGTQVGSLPAGYETSGLAWHDGLGRLLAVDDGGVLSSMDATGGNQVHWAIGGDLEGVCVADPRSHFAYVGVEHPDAILEVDLRSGSVTRRFDLTPWLSGPDNQGLEALAFIPDAANPEGGVFLAGLQSDGLAYAFELPIASSRVSTTASFLRSFPVAPGLTDIADMSFDPATGVLYSVFDAADRLVATDASGTLLGQWDLPGTEQEGILYRSGALYVSEDFGGVVPGVVIRYDHFLPPLSPPTPQYTVNQPPRLQPGDAPLPGYPGSDLDRVDVLWQTVPAGTGTEDAFSVEVRLSGGEWRPVAVGTPIETGLGGRLVWSASIPGLAWNTAYEYRVRHLRAGEVVAEYASGFRTRLRSGDPSSFSFVAYGDSATASAAGFRAVQRRINQSDAAFAVLLGDNAYSTGSHADYDARFDPTASPEATAWTSSRIDYVGFGNHDVATSGGLPTEQNYSVPIPVKGVTAPAAPPVDERPEHNYSWDYGSVHFVAFDSNTLVDPLRLDGVLNWVVADLAASTARWKIVIAHHPVAGVPDKPQAASDDYYQQVVGRLKPAGVDLLMTGHSHTYARSYPLTGQVQGVATFADQASSGRFIAGQGLIQLVSGVGGAEIRAGGFTAFPFVAAGFSGSTPVAARCGFSRIDVSADRLVVKYVAADDGGVIDTFTIEKEASQTVSFQQGVGGYTGTVDTFVHQYWPTAGFGTVPSLKVDTDNPTGTAHATQALLQFQNLFGPQPGRIPLNATIRSATLQLSVTNGGNAIDLHRMATAWSPAATWRSLGNGIQADGAEAMAFADASTGSVFTGTLSVDVLASVRAWQARPGENFGWGLLPTGADGVDFLSAEGAVAPRLVVTFVPGAAPVATLPQFYVVDGTTARVDRLATSGAQLGLVESPVALARPRGIAASPDGSRLWVLGAGGTVSVYDAGMRRLGAWTAAGLVRPTGIAIVGRDIWMTDAGRGRVVVFPNAVPRLSGAQVASRSFALAAPNASAQDLATDGRTVWVVDAGAVARVFVYRADSGAVAGAWALAMANRAPTGITIDPTGRNTAIWVVDAATKRVYAYAGGRALRSGRGLSTSVFALSASIRDPQGITDPPVSTSKRRPSHPASGWPRVVVSPPKSPPRNGAEPDRREPTANTP